MKFRPTAEITFRYIFSSYVGIDQKLFACSPVPIDPQFQARIGRSIRPPNEARTGTENRNLMPTDVSRKFNTVIPMGRLEFAILCSCSKQQNHSLSYIEDQQQTEEVSLSLGRLIPISASDASLQSPHYGKTRFLLGPLFADLNYGAH